MTRPLYKLHSNTVKQLSNVIGKDEVLQGGIYHFDNKPFIVKELHKDMEFTREELYTVPIWVKLPGLDFKYWGPKGLNKIGSMIGKPLMVDRNTENKIGLNFARLLIEVDVDSPLPDKVQFRNEKGALIEQRIQYDWKPVLCKQCHKYGHSEEDCRRKKQTAPPKQQTVDPEVKDTNKEQGENNQALAASRVEITKPVGEKESIKTIGGKMNAEGWVLRNKYNILQQNTTLSVC
ncbi:PREDICTED: uncharacterized protein LOC109228098 [Nicotiana attenuata]|uniref:uncharacterized protein LOC109228098 n=1 Tax=Nicotiana attenuata TaxID=49451 RepID=UPI0009055D75|nr:PREDICTED: uncharacterized protein LOC109228098 [Nicotiana attenuata]